VKKVYGMARYGTSRSYRSSGSKRGYAGSGRRRSYRKMAGRGARKLKFATVGYSRDVEKKYYDKGMGIPGNQRMLVEGSAADPEGMWGASWVNNADSWGDVDETGSAAKTLVQDLLKGVRQGTNAGARIGNVISVKYVKGSIMLEANSVKNKTDSSENAQYGESALTNTGTTNLMQFVRTTWYLF
jgi:hypothetical protein